MRAHAQRNARMQHAYTDALTHPRALMKTASILHPKERVVGGDSSNTLTGMSRTLPATPSVTSMSHYWHREALV